MSSPSVNYEDLYEEFILLTSSSSSSSPSVGDQFSPPPNQRQLTEISKRQMPESVKIAEQQLQSQPEGPQRMSVISIAGFPIASNTSREQSEGTGMSSQSEDTVMNSQGGPQSEDQLDTGMQKEQPNADELRKLLCAPTMPSPRCPPFMNQQYQFPPQHFLAQCSPMSPTPTANIAWGGHGHTHCHNPQMNHSPPQNMNNYFNQQQFITSHHHQHSQQQTLVHHTTQSNNTGQQICQQYQHQQQQIMNTINLRSTHWDNQPFPGGLNELWRKLPVECQKFLTPQDIPESARFRGYFTVCELLVLKRTLLARYGGSTVEDHNNDDETEKGIGTQNSSCGKHISKKRKRSALERTDDDQHDEDAELQASCEVTVTVGVAVKEALDALDEEQQQQSQANSNSLNTMQVPIHDQNGPSTVAQIITQTSGATSATQNQGQGSTAGTQKVSMGPPPPYRTAQLVFRLLQIGNYQLRSFADLTPNKFKVLYNTQRIIYECQLPIVLPQRDDMQPLRKLLTIDIGFDQILFVTFGNDKMFLKIDGAPLLTVTYNAITDDDTSSPVSFQEQQLLDQIDRGQLKLSPCHQVFFINERLVHMLESQFRDHPRLKHLLFDNATNAMY